MLATRSLSIKCKIGFGISEPNSDNVKYYYSNAPGAEECGNDADANPVNHAVGCYVRQKIFN